MSSPNLWWAYDGESGSFSTLPTGPFLLPAIAIVLAATIFRSLFSGATTAKEVAGHLSKTKEWQSKYQRYQQLVATFVENNGDISIAETYELDQLEAYLNNPHNHRLS
jgi:hypothetical protein